MAMTPATKVRLEDHIEDLQINTNKRFDDAKTDARWYTTLVFAELAGITTYVGYPVSSSLNHYSIVVLVLVIALVFFVNASIQTQREKADYGRRHVITKSRIRNIDAANDINPDIGDSAATEVVDDFADTEILKIYEIVELGGLISFCIATVLAAGFVFIAALVASLASFLNWISGLFFT